MSSFFSAQAVNVAILVFREGLECVLVLAAILAGMEKTGAGNRRPVIAGVFIGILATLATWFIAVGMLDSLSESVPALHLQAATGLLAIIVLLIVMNWFFHKLYWTGWISLHNRRKRNLLENSQDPTSSRARLFFGLGLLGFTSFYREGVEVVLFLQSYRLKFGNSAILHGLAPGVVATCAIGMLTFLAHRKLPYRRMLVITGVMLGAVLLVMVGEQAQEMQQANWLTTTQIPFLQSWTRDWMGLWLSIFPTVETLAAQVLAGILVIGSYAAARHRG